MEPTVVKQMASALGARPTGPNAGRGIGRVCLADYSNADIMACFTHNPIVGQAITNVIGQSSPSRAHDWAVSNRGLGGDKCEAATLGWQLLHSDWPSLRTKTTRLGYALACSIAPADIGLDFGPIRCYSWEDLNDEQYYNQMPLDLEFSELDPRASRLEMFAGECLLRDVRAAHAGTPNLTDEDRILPGFQIMSPQYIEHLNYYGW